MPLTNLLLLTLALDYQSQMYFNTLRTEYFPPERNFLDAHLMLFHQLPANEPAIIDSIVAEAGRYGIMQLQVTGLVSIGKGVACKISSESLQALHRRLQQQWADWLIPQDKQKLWPHITIQNKVTPQLAKETLDKLKPGFEPFEITATGLALWEYLGGPWRFIEAYNFSRS